MRNVTALILSLLVASAIAQGPGGPRGPGGPGGPRGQGGPSGRRFDPKEMAKRQLDRLTKDLKLTPKQIPQVKAIIESAATERGKLFTPGSGRPDFAKLRPKMEKIQETTSAKLKKVLTAAQYKKYQEDEKERRMRLQQRMGAGPGGFGAPGAGRPGGVPPTGAPGPKKKG